MHDTDTIDTIAPQERDLSTELVPQSDARVCFVSIDPERLGGVPCFVGTRVPIKYLWEYLMKGKTLEAFLDDFEGVPRQEAIAALQQAYERLLEGLPRPGSIAESALKRSSLLAGHRGSENLPQGAAEARE
jgi:uncharacterized protein (DUF433 family)